MSPRTSHDGAGLGAALGAGWARTAVTVLVPAATVLAAASCERAPTAVVVEPIGVSRAYDSWQPGPGECAVSIHNAYSTVGPDGRIYPTWHPPIDPLTGCSFGHEHGRDPSGSALYGEVGAIPFGYANEMLAEQGSHDRRHEDHVGHKIEWENGLRMTVTGVAGQAVDITCHVLTKLHQGSHSKDAFANNLHELVYALRCSDRTAMRVTLLVPIGAPGELVASCDRSRRLSVGQPTPRSSPVGSGKRAIPDRLCVERFMMVPPGERSNYDAALRESWEVHFSIKRADGRTLAAAEPYFHIMYPSRFFDPTQPDNLGRSIQLCYDTLPGGRAARGGLCDVSTGHGMLADVGYDDVRSPFNGARRFVDINGNRVMNEAGPEIWYTDPMGQRAVAEPFPGSIRQFIARTDNSSRMVSGPVIGRNRDYGVPGVRAPN